MKLTGATFDKSRELTLYARVNEDSVPKVLTFVNADGSAHDISSYNFALYIRQTDSSTANLISLTIGNGLTIQGVGNNELLIEITEAQATVRPKVYFWRLYSITDKNTWLNGDFFFHSGKYDGVDNQTDSITISTDSETVTITIEGGGGGAVTLASLGTTLQTAAVDMPLDADTFNFYDAVDAVLKKVTWSNIKDTLKTYFDGLYVALTGDQTIAGVKTFSSSPIVPNPTTPTQAANKSYVDSAVTGLFEFKGSTDCSSNPNYPSGVIGDAYVVSVAGKIGGASGKTVDAGDIYIAIVDNAGGTEASVGASWVVIEHNLIGALLSANNLSDLTNAATARTNLGLGTGNSPTFTDVSVGDEAYGAGWNGSLEVPTKNALYDRIEPRVSTTTTTTSLTPDPSSFDIYSVTDLATAITINNPSTAVNGYSFIVRIKDDGTARAVNFGADYEAIAGALPSTTTVGETLYIPIIYNSNSLKWEVAVASSFDNPMTTVGDLIIGGTSGVPTRLAASSTAGHVLTSNGAGVAPSYQAAAGGWATSGTTTLTGACTISSTTPSGLLFTNTWTATANNQSMKRIAGTITTRNTASDEIYGLDLAPTINQNAGSPASQTYVGLNVNPAFGISTGTTNIARFGQSGTYYFTLALGGATFTRGQNAAWTGLTVTNSTNGTASRSGIAINSSSIGASLYCTAASYTTSGINEAASTILQSNSGALVLGTSNNQNVRFFQNNTLRAVLSSTSFTVSVRHINSQGADVASVAGAITLGSDGNTFEITGTNAITLISNTNWQNGSEINLIFTSTATLTDGVANSGTDIGMELSGGANFVSSADDVVKLLLCEIGGVQRWREVSRSVN